MFEIMDITESIYEGVVEPPYKKTARADTNHAGHSRLNRGELALSNTHSKMNESNGNHRERYIDHPKGRSKPTYLIHDPVHS